MMIRKQGGAKRYIWLFSSNLYKSGDSSMHGGNVAVREHPRTYLWAIGTILDTEWFSIAGTSSLAARASCMARWPVEVNNWS